MQDNFMEELRNKKDLYKDPPFKKVIV